MPGSPNLPHSPSGPNSIARSLAGATLRFGAYTISVFALILIIWWLAAHSGHGLFEEGSTLEGIQFGLMVVTTAIYLTAAWRINAFRPLLLLLAALSSLAAIRELDLYFDRWLPLVGWQFPFILVIGAGIVCGLKTRAAIANQLQQFVLHRSIGMLWAGFIVAIPFAQMIGHGDFLESIYDEDYDRSLKRIIEECAEVIGYLILLLGAIDWTMHVRRLASQ